MTQAIYHEMRRREGFEETAGKLWALVCASARMFPGEPRELFLDIEGHTRQGARDRYDDDATELISFVRAALGPYLTETPMWGKTVEGPQKEPGDGQIIFIAPRAGDDRAWLLTGDSDRPVERAPIPAPEGGEPK